MDFLEISIGFFTCQVKLDNLGYIFIKLIVPRFSGNNNFSITSSTQRCASIKLNVNYIDRAFFLFVIQT
jgi:hypothetical protein